MDLDWVEDLLSDAREGVLAIAGEAPRDFEQLEAEVVAYREHLHRAAHPLTDLETVDSLTVATLSLLAEARTRAEPERGLASLAARYFVQRSTDPDDLPSPFGFDDEVEVFNAVAARLAPALVIG
jgi:hypothetical protein